MFDERIEKEAEVDNEVLINADENYLRIGDFANIIIESAEEYDLYGSLAK